MTDYKEVTTTQHEQGSQAANYYIQSHPIGLVIIRAARGFDCIKDSVQADSS